MPICPITLRAVKPKPDGYPHNPKSLGEHIRKRRMDLGLFQRDVAANVGAKVTSVTNWEKGHAEPEIRFLPAILVFLGADPRPQAETLGDKLVAFRVAKGWARPRLAAELRVDPSTLARWERGIRLPWGNYVERVAKILSTT